MLHGGCFGGMVALAGYSLASGQNAGLTFDAAAFGLPLGEAIGRLGCHVYGCCWGKPTECSLGVRYLSEHAKIVRCAPELHGVKVHPVQLYSCVASLLLYALFLGLLPCKSFDGMYLVLWCLLHPPLRVALEQFRGDDRGRCLTRFTHTQVYSALLLAWGLAGLAYFPRQGMNTPLDLTVTWSSVVSVPTVAIPLGAIAAIVMAAFGLHYRTVGNWTAAPDGEGDSPIVLGSTRKIATVPDQGEALATSGQSSADEHLLATDVLIVGAGPYGISLSYELHRAGVRFLIVGEPFSLWRRHVLSATTLRSDINASQVFARDHRFNLREFLRATYPADEAARIARQRIPVEVFRQYADWILGRLPYRPIEQKVVRLAQRGEGGFVAELADGRRIVARRVVLAGGIEAHRVLPSSLQAISPRLALHSWRVSEVEAARGERLLIVGGGQSAAEIVAHLAVANDITWVHRSPLIFFAEPINLPRPVFALVLRASLIYYFLPDPLRKLLGSLFVAATITPELKPRIVRDGVQRIECDADELGLVEQDGRVYSRRLERSFDRVVACTGYRFALDSLDYLSPELRGKIRLNRLGTPALGFRFESSVPGLFMIGGIAEPRHGPALRFIIGCRQATLRVSRALRR